ncbi:hydrolase [Bordetella genomosp. 9]|uniref:HD domain-containing protein n=1 Tax=Bordetella genomosp. 9 TaxID=1416803 RepID=UPI000A294E75|nr:HD domain-containing protein [Bordetella genomosp. 9]ARP91832.1 hydrolase [Bordetella genomosp. 9]
MAHIEPLLVAWRPRLRRLAAAYAGADAAHDMNHLERVWANARQILASHPDANRLVVMAACYLHDLINLPKNHPQRAQASAMSAREAVVQLQRLAFPGEYLDEVAHAIEAHSHSAGIRARSIEAKIVQDADRLDALGAVGLARMFHIGGQLNRPLAHGTDPLAAERPLDDSLYALDHIEKKLLRLPATMQTDTGRKLAAARAETLVEFRDRFVAEWMGLGDGIAAPGHDGSTS